MNVCHCVEKDFKNIFAISVSTIPEESEEQVAERNLKIEQSIRLNRVREEEPTIGRSITPSRSRSSTPSKGVVIKGVSSPSRITKSPSRTIAKSPSRTAKSPCRIPSRGAAGTPDIRVPSRTNSRIDRAPSRTDKKGGAEDKKGKKDTKDVAKPKDLNLTPKKGKEGSKVTPKTSPTEESANNKKKLNTAQKSKSLEEKETTSKEVGKPKTSPYSEEQKVVAEGDSSKPHDKGKETVATLDKRKLDRLGQSLPLDMMKVDGQWALEENMDLQYSEEEEDEEVGGSMMIHSSIHSYFMNVITVFRTQKNSFFKGVQKSQLALLNSQCYM